MSTKTSKLLVLIITVVSAFVVGGAYAIMRDQGAVITSLFFVVGVFLLAFLIKTVWDLF